MSSCELRKAESEIEAEVVFKLLIFKAHCGLALYYI